MYNDRINYIDYVKGFTILCVLLGHMKIDPVLKHSIYSFHMPLFFILSGYFIKKEKLHKTSIVKNFKVLMIPYFIVGGGMCIWQLFSNYDAFMKLETSSLASLIFLGYRVKGEDVIRFMGPIWFLWVLFLSKIYTQYMLTRKYGVGTLCVIAFFSMLFTRLTHIVPPLGLLQSLTASLFLLIGYNLKEKDVFNIHITKAVYGIMLLFAIFLMINVPVALRVNGLNVFSCITSTFISYVIIKSFQMLDQLKSPFVMQIKRFLIFCGRNSLVFLCVHTIEARYHWLSLDKNLIGIEFVLRTCYILLIIMVLSNIVFAKKIFRIQ